MLSPLPLAILEMLVSLVLVAETHMCSEMKRWSESCMVACSCVQIWRLHPMKDAVYEGVSFKGCLECNGLLCGGFSICTGASLFLRKRCSCHLPTLVITTPVCNELWNVSWLRIHPLDPSLPWNRKMHFSGQQMKKPLKWDSLALAFKCSLRRMSLTNRDTARVSLSTKTVAGHS